MEGARVRWMVVCVLLQLGGCLQSSVTTCDNGIVCPADQACGPAGGCVDPAQLSSCDGAADGTRCTLPGIGDGVCVGAVCIVTRCGDGIVDIGEACDDPDPDACTPNCALPTCGDGIVQTGEVCDEGAANSDDRACTTRCIAAVCGDGFVFDGTEECDDTVQNGDSGACTSACLRNRCGDGAVWAGVEPCDDGNTASGDGCRDDCRKVEVCGDATRDVGEACDDGNINAADGCDACTETTWQASVVFGGSALAPNYDVLSVGALAVDREGNMYVGSASQIYRVDVATTAVTVVAGTGAPGFTGDGGSATSAQISDPSAIAVDGLGNVYFADRDNHRVRMITASTGVIDTVAGNGFSGGSSGDGGLAPSAVVPYPNSIAVSGLGDLYVGDYNCRIRRVDAATRLISTVAGTTCGYAGEGVAATAAQLSQPLALLVDAANNVYVADYANNRVRRIDGSTNVITTLVGPSAIDHPLGLALEAGELWITENTQHRIRRFTLATSAIVTVAGTGSPGFSGDGGSGTSAAIRNPGAVGRCKSGLCFADSGNKRVRRLTDAGGITTVFGSGATSRIEAATTTVIDGYRVVVHGTEELYFAEFARVRHRDASGIVRTIAGTGATGSAGDGGLASNATFGGQLDVAIDASGNIYVADTNNCKVRRINGVTKVITTVAGDNCFSGATSDGGQATGARLGSVPGVALDASRNLYIADATNYRVRRVDATTGIITTVAGNGTQGSLGDEGLATDAQLFEPYALAFDGAGHLFIADRAGHRIRRVDATTQFITTIAGTGTPGATGDNGPAASALLDRPSDVDVDDLGNVYIADYNNQRVRKVTTGTGTITAVLGTGTPGFIGDGALATNAWASYPVGVAVRGNAELFALTGGMVRRVDLASNGVTTVAGRIDPGGMGPLTQASLADPRAFTTTPAFTLFAGGDSGTLQAARASTLEVVAGRYPQATATTQLARFRTQAFGAVGGVAYDAATSKIYISERAGAYDGHVIHAVTPVDVADESTWTIATFAGIAGAAGFADGTSLTTARFRDPTALFLDAAAQVLYVTDTGNHVIRAIDLQAGTIATVAGTPQQLGFFGDGGDATDALLYQPQAVTRCGNGDVFVADTGNHRVRRISQGTITTVLGDGVAASSGAGSPASTFPVDTPLGLACDAFGNLFVTSSSTVRLLPANDLGIVDGTGPVQTIYGGAPRTSFPAAVSFCLTGLAVVDATTVRMTDSCTGIFIQLHRQPL